MAKNFSTNNVNTWCPGCTNFMILESAKRAMKKMAEKGMKHEDFAIVAGIGCHAKIFDYLNVSGIYGLHGRVIPTALGIKLGNPKLHVIGFAGDGDTYSEGMEHFIHAFRYNPDMTLIVHDNRDFSLTGGQPSATSQKGYKSKFQPFGEINDPLNPIKLALAAGAGFVARCDARDIEHTAEIIERAVKHKGFSFIEVVQDCLIFNKEFNNLKSAHKVDNRDPEKAWELAEEWNYNSKAGKIPTGVIYSAEKDSLYEKQSKLKKLAGI